MEKQKKKPLYAKCWFKTIIWIIILIAIIALIAGNVLYAIYGCQENKSDLLTVISGWVSGIATIFLGIVALRQNEKYKDDADKDKEILLKQNEHIALENSRLNVLPYFTVTQIPYRVTQNLFDNIETEKKEAKVVERYEEGLSWYFAIILNENNISLAKTEPIEIKKCKSQVFELKRDLNGVKVAVERRDNYCPVLIKNIGLKDAVNFSFEISKEGDDLGKYTESITPRLFSLNDELRLDFYTPNKNIRNTFWLKFTYYDIIGNFYYQKDKIVFGTDDAGFYLEFKQHLNDKK
ncbi:MAG: hypothetical protein J5762_04440 [Clostridia bacterium]|nr:hypothetical protein [Clostridia bacterium]